MAKHIYLIRHGQTDYNLQGIVQGSGVNTDLNETGRLQALKFWENYQHIPFEKVYTSVLNRSVQSVESFINKGIPHEALEGLNEINWGNTEGTKVSMKENQMYQELMQRWRAGDTHIALPNGESPLELMQKQQKVMDIILSRAEHPILMCMHGRAIRVLLSWLVNKDLSTMDDFLHTNLSLYLLEVKNNQIEIIKHNDISHL